MPSRISFILEMLRLSIKANPSVLDNLKGVNRFVALWAITPRARKNAEGLQQAIEKQVRRVYNGKVSTVEFTDTVSKLIIGQMKGAFLQAWIDSGVGSLTAPYPEYLEQAMVNFIYDATNMEWSYNYYRDITDARLRGVPVDGLLARAALWGARWNEAYNQALLLIALNEGILLEWVEGDTRDKCDQCVGLDGIIAHAAIWKKLNVHPQKGPNDKLGCGGWNCKCYFRSVPKGKPTRGAEARIRKITGG